ncbi:hypothetical protein Ddye_011645 [Dipteronia dyeriana]|uniref:DUF659 domain-containing protein n=1 Tax=Dipteronia dyeriana TaxID=168575 RepID=A0AAE0CHB2_9ROSI|nr:hypothetical protein Ddye_011645 [Dipteronia dyeriana]
MVDAIGQFGPSFKPSSQWQSREPLLNEEFETTKEAFKKQEQLSKVDGCSIMMDAWTDRKMRSIMNLCVNCKEGIGKLQKFKSTLEETKSFTIFIYAHHTTLVLMRTFTRKRDIVRSRITRELKKAEEEIREGLKNGKSNYRPILDIIDEKSKGRLDSPLHLAAYVLNPYYFFNVPTSSIYTTEVSNGFCSFAEILYPNDLEKQNLFVNIEFGKYSNKEGPFRRPLTLKGCEKNYEFYNLVHPAVKEIGAHLRGLMDKRKRGTDKKVDILLANDASNSQGWIVDDGDDEIEPGSGIDDGEVRDLEDDFQSDNDAIKKNVEFESDDDVIFQLDEYVMEDEALKTLS